MRDSAMLGKWIGSYIELEQGEVMWCDVMCEAETLGVWLGHSEEGDDAGAGRDKSLRWRMDDF